MSDSETNSLYYSIFNKIKKISSLKEELFCLDQKINQIKTENKSLCAREYEFIYQVLDVEKKMYQLAGEKEKNLTLLNYNKNLHQEYVERLENLNKIKSKVFSSCQRMKFCLQRKAFKIKKFNEENRIIEKTDSLYRRTNSIGAVKSFSYQDASLLSNIYDLMKLFYKRQYDKIKFSNSEVKNKLDRYNKEFKDLKSKVSELFSMISFNYSDIIIEEFINLDVFSLSEVLAKVNLQIGLKKIKFEKEIKETDLEYEKYKTNIETLDEEIIKRYLNIRNLKNKRKCFIFLKNMTKVRIARREKEEEENLKKVKERMEKEKEMAEKLEKARLEKEKQEKQEKQERDRIEKGLDEKVEKLQKERHLKDKLEKERHDKYRKDLERQILEYETSTNIASEKSNFNSTVQNIPEKNTKKKRGQNSNNNITMKKQIAYQKNNNNLNTNHNTSLYVNINEEENNNNNNNSNNTNTATMTKTSNNFNPRYNFKVDIPTLEESFSKNITGSGTGSFTGTENNQNNFNNFSNKFLDEISKNINEVSDFPIKSTFGGGKKKSYFNLI